MNFANHEGDFECQTLSSWRSFSSAPRFGEADGGYTDLCGAMLHSIWIGDIYAEKR